MAGLIEEFLGEVEGGEVAITEMPEAECGTTGAATGFEERRGFIGEEAFDQDALGLPEAEEVRGARVVDDGDRVVEVGADGGARYFFNHSDTEKRPDWALLENASALSRSFRFKSIFAFPRGDEHAVGVELVGPEEGLGFRE